MRQEVEGDEADVQGVDVQGLAEEEGEGPVLLVQANSKPPLLLPPVW